MVGVMINPKRNLHFWKCEKVLLQMVSIHRPLGYEPNTLPLRHGALVSNGTLYSIKLLS